MKIDIESKTIRFNRFQKFKMFRFVFSHQKQSKKKGEETEKPCLTPPAQWEKLEGYFAVIADLPQPRTRISALTPSLNGTTKIITPPMTPMIIGIHAEGSYPNHSVKVNAGGAGSTALAVPAVSVNRNANANSNKNILTIGFLLDPRADLMNSPEKDEIRRSIVMINLLQSCLLWQSEPFQKRMAKRETTPTQNQDFPWIDRETFPVRLSK